MDSASISITDKTQVEVKRVSCVFLIVNLHGKAQDFIILQRAKEKKKIFR